MNDTSQQGQAWLGVILKNVSALLKCQRPMLDWEKPLRHQAAALERLTR